MLLQEFFSYSFILRALAGGCLVGALCGMLGVFLVLRRLSLIGDGLSHVTFGSVALAMLLGVTQVPVTVAAIPVVMLCSLGILRLTEKAGGHADASIGIVSSLGVAGGIIIASLAGGFNVDLFSYLFGNILSISGVEVRISLALFVLVLLAVFLFYNDLFAVTFDEELARTSGIRTGRINTILVLITALVVVLAMKVVGIMLVSALIILPSVTALQLAQGFRGALLLSVLTAVVAVTTGIFVSFSLNLPAGATVIVVNFLLFCLACLVRRLR
ncbi:MAG TPA: metal ABC transporter permease [Verrucomicrobiae bacterium]|nr:metal ABC transporter permease [Verrucomicrobiae bacterium]